MLNRSIYPKFVNIGRKTPIIPGENPRQELHNLKMIKLAEEMRRDQGREAGSGLMGYSRGTTFHLPSYVLRDLKKSRGKTKKRKLKHKKLKKRKSKKRRPTKRTRSTKRKNYKKTKKH